MESSLPDSDRVKQIEVSQAISLMLFLSARLFLSQCHHVFFHASIDVFCFDNEMIRRSAFPEWNVIAACSRRRVSAASGHRMTVQQTETSVARSLVTVSLRVGSNKACGSGSDEEFWPLVVCNVVEKTGSFSYN